MYAIYVIQNDATNERYFGYTSNLKARIKKHNARGTKSTTRKKGTWHYIYIELYRNEADARSREAKLKNHGSGKHELLKRIQNSLL